MSSITQEQLDNAMEAARCAWWEMLLPSGEITFSPNKTKMLGYDSTEDRFKHYKGFTDLVHPADYEPMMEDMRAHMRGDKPVYETIYRIMDSTGEYQRFYDRGKIVEKDGETMRIAGIVTNVTLLSDYVYHVMDGIDEQVKEEKAKNDGISDSH